MKTTNVLPYLIKAYLAWAEENRLTPQIRVNTSQAGVSVPPGAAGKDGWIVLTVSQCATSCFAIDETTMCFDARFNQRSMPVVVPLIAIHALFCREGTAANFLPQAQLLEATSGVLGSIQEMLTWTLISKKETDIVTEYVTTPSPPTPAPRKNHLRSV